jgi:geranyl-CoA carboxylase alpha subunit
MPKIQKLLIANRNEIARRILRAAKVMGIRTVAVYSEADATALHVTQADEAYCIGPAPSLESYLCISTLIDTALKAGADAIHPGYGFVSENPALAAACKAAGITLVGPSEQAIADMADKARAKHIAAQAGLPCIPGFAQESATASALQSAAQQIGYPVMIKALAGGGGRGMRLVENDAQFASQLHSAQLEAKNAFGDDRVMLEKAIINPRHIEIQVLADQHGHAIHLGERDCSVQRRHQKIVEEAPSPAVNMELRARMGEAALKLVQATGYEGAGTVEFLLDEAGEFYFIEMNTRLQVEHGVTEAITGIDLVQWQLRIASGEVLHLKQSDIEFNGHAIQGRLCAEDPAQNFLPQTGPVLAWQAPPNDRCDHALFEGGEVSPWYDSLLAKIIAHAPTRKQACDKLSTALGQTTLLGFQHNGAYLQAIAQHPVFQSGEFGTGFLEQHADVLLKNPTANAHLAVASTIQAFTPNATATAWPHELAAFSSTRALVRPIKLEFDKTAFDLRIEKQPKGFLVEGLDKAMHLENWHIEFTGQQWHVRTHVNGRSMQFTGANTIHGMWLKGAESAHVVFIRNMTLQSATSNQDGVFQPQIKSPMTGKITQVLVKPGQHVEPGTVMMCLEAMKMEHRIVAKTPAVVEAVLAQVGEQMKLNQVMLSLKEAQPENIQ